MVRKSQIAWDDEKQCFQLSPLCYAFLELKTNPFDSPVQMKQLSIPIPTEKKKKKTKKEQKEQRKKTEMTIKVLIDAKFCLTYTSCAQNSE